MSDASPGTAVLGGRYHLERLVARGGMAEVWEGSDAVLARPVAIKVLHAHLAAQPGVAERFRREAIAAARLVHPGIVSMYDARVEGDDAYLVMELVRGADLRQLLHDRGGRLSPQVAVHLAAQVADALHYAHENGLVHRDVKPGNILCDGDRARVADFGIAKAAAGGEVDVTQDGAIVGTAAYLAPEQVRGLPVDRRADVYALGVVLYEMVCGRKPFEADNDLALAIQRLDRDPLRPRQVVAGIPRPLEDVILKAMAREPDDRFATAADLRTALLAVDLEDDAVPLVAPDPTPPGGIEVASRPPDRSWVVPALVVFLVALAVGVVLVLLARGLDDDDAPGGTGDEVAGAPEPAALADARSFDPLGDGDEHEEEAGNVLDDDPATTWSTSRYRRADFGGLKPGAGIVVVLGSASVVRRVEVQSPTPGWTAQVYVADSPRSTLEAWGSPVATVRAEREVTAVDLTAAAPGKAVLLWLTSLPRDGGEFSAEIGDLRVLADPRS